MSDDKDNEFERDFSEQSSNEEGLTEESNLENSDENSIFLYADISKVIYPINENTEPTLEENLLKYNLLVVFIYKIAKFIYMVKCCATTTT